MKILIIEDEINLAEALSQILKKHKYAVDCAFDGIEGLDNALSGIYDLILLDIMLPKLDGISVLKALREEGINAPVIMLTAKSGLNDKINGLDSGADDYLAKPFEVEELLARIRAISRRKGEASIENTIKYGDIVLDPSSLSLNRGEKSVTLTLKESELLEFLIFRNKMITPKELIIEKIWGFEKDIDDNNVEVYISFIRKKLIYLKSKVSISTVRGAGYILKGDE